MVGAGSSKPLPKIPQASSKQLILLELEPETSKIKIKLKTPDGLLSQADGNNNTGPIHF